MEGIKQNCYLVVTFIGKDAGASTVQPNRQAIRDMRQLEKICADFGGLYRNTSVNYEDDIPGTPDHVPKTISSEEKIYQVMKWSVTHRVSDSGRETEMSLYFRDVEGETAEELLGLVHGEELDFYQAIREFYGSEKKIEKREIEF